MINLYYKNWQPFGCLTDVEFNNVINFLNCDNDAQNVISLDNLNQMVFHQFNVNIDNHNVDVDPDSNFFMSGRDLESKCNYIFVDNNNDVLNGDKDLFSIFSLNINSFPKKFDSFISDICSNLKEIDVYCFCETKLSKEIEHLYNIHNYQQITLNYTRSSGGLALYVKDTYNDKIFVRNDLKRQLNSIESLFIEIKTGVKDLIIGVIYRRPNTIFNSFILELESLLEIIRSENKKVYITGDFNLNLLNLGDNNNVKEFVDLFHSNNFFNVVTKPTRVANSSATLLDHLWTNDYNNCTFNNILYYNLSDHFPIICSFSNRITVNRNQNKSSTFYRNFDNTNMSNFKSDLQDVDWQLIFSSTNPNVSYENFSLIFTSLFEKHFPLIEKVIYPDKNKLPYITPELKSLIKNKNKLQRLAAKWPLTYNEKFKTLRNLVNSKLRIAKFQYYKNKLSGCVGDARGTWEVINKVMKRKTGNNTNDIPCIDNNDVLLTDSLDIANAFNAHFSTIATTLSDKIIDNNLDPLTYLDYRNENIMSFDEISHDEFVKIVESLNDAAPGVDSIPAAVVKDVLNEIKNPLIHIFNCSLRFGIFPNELKVSKVIPLFKQGCRRNLNNYRPISILPVFSKILEKLIYNRLDEFFENNNILIDSQYDFRKHRSTTSAVLRLTDHILKSFDEKKFTLGVFLDLSKAFDCVNHDILLRKLDYYGVRGIALDLLKSYLSDRQQFTFYKNTISQPCSIIHSVPQGSILGPLLFNIYINDIINATKILKTILFADDSCFYYTHKNVIDLINVINNELVLINDWFISNKLTLNIKKSHCIIFKRKLNIPSNLPKITISNNNLEFVDDTLFLGIIIQCDLKWTLHIQSIKNKLNKYSSIIYQTRHSLDSNSLKLIYKSLVQSCLNYGNVIWGNSPSSHTNCLFIAQKRVIRNIKSRNRHHHTNDDFYNLGILKLKDLNYYHGSIFVYKSLNGLTYPCDYFEIIENTTRYPLRNSLNVRPPLPHSTQSKTSAAFYCCALWNKLPLFIRSKPSVASFKFSIRKYLVDKYSQQS